ncbi:uncharacterized protein LOC115741531 [Rhodamnia argentea]|uniref:Uncharacterized protein LOC115741531 n=1 Tax=Rhodamnia argentea TaxID=178133 RepID=A0A8B8P9N3_9MYRT|nr:uncharacterized protein LOC115741531 [Rhodamnia argentea]
MRTERSAMAGSPDPISDHPSSASTCCFCFPRFRTRASPPASGLSFWERVGSSGHRRHDDAEGWWARGLRSLKKLREWSEIAAGPKWKTFIRRFNRRPHRHGRFNYDALDYALNFDEGQNGDVDEEGEKGTGFLNFSARFASLPGSIKSDPAKATATAPAVDLGRASEVPVFA